VAAKETTPMDLPVETIEITIRAYLKQMRERLEQAVGIARAAQACADAGQVEKGIEVALDVEQLVYEISTCLNAASMVNRLGKA
jgi:hypothetical protein